MFAFNRSAIAVLAPLALLVGAVLWSNMDTRPVATQQVQAQQNPSQGIDRAQTVAANLPSK